MFLSCNFCCSVSKMCCRDVQTTFSRNNSLNAVYYLIQFLFTISRRPTKKLSSTTCNEYEARADKWALFSNRCRNEWFFNFHQTTSPATLCLPCVCSRQSSNVKTLIWSLYKRILSESLLFLTNVLPYGTVKTFQQLSASCSFMQLCTFPALVVAAGNSIDSVVSNLTEKTRPIMDSCNYLARWNSRKGHGKWLVIMNTFSCIPFAIVLGRIEFSRQNVHLE